VTDETFSIQVLRRRFTALQRELAFFDGPAGTQCPDSVVEAIVHYVTHDNANTGGAYPTSQRSDALVVDAHQAAARFLGCAATEISFGQSMTSLNFLLTRALASSLVAGDEVLVTTLDHDANVAPWLRLATDRGIVVRLVDVRDDLSLDISDLASKLSRRTRIVAFPVAANSVGTETDVRRIAELAHQAGALAWVDAVHFAPHGPIDVRAWDVDVLLCSSYKFFGPHLGLSYVRESLLETWPAYKIRPAPDHPAGSRFELGTCQHELLAGFIAAVRYIESVGWKAIRAHERALGERFLHGLPASVNLFGLPSMNGRVPTFSFNIPGHAPEAVARHLSNVHQLAVGSGNHYAIELIKRLRLDPESGTVRVGFIHYNTDEEVDRLLVGIRSLV
jgi:cysteine desulfurase family protein (TIGR01976 family)